MVNLRETEERRGLRCKQDREAKEAEDWARIEEDCSKCEDWTLNLKDSGKEGDSKLNRDSRNKETSLRK